MNFLLSDNKRFIITVGLAVMIFIGGIFLLYDSSRVVYGGTCCKKKNVCEGDAGKECCDKPDQICCDDGTCDFKGKWIYQFTLTDVKKVINTLTGKYILTVAWQDFPSPGDHNFAPVVKCKINKTKWQWEAEVFNIGKSKHYLKSECGEIDTKDKFIKTGGPECKVTDRTQLPMLHSPYQYVYGGGTPDPCGQLEGKTGDIPCSSY